jgi:type II secretory pathway pseudopilin PulG
VSGSKRLQAGDTIVEVMIAIVVISTVLAGAFLVSRTSLKNVRDSEEHSQALKLVQGQVELLRQAAGRVTSGSSFPSSFCLDASGATQTGPACKTDFYTLSIKSLGAVANTYQITAQWDSISGGTGQVQIAYRVVFATP